MNIDPPSTCWVSARLMTDAMIGPTHGVQIRPRLKPTTSPLQNPARRVAATAPAGAAPPLDVARGGPERVEGPLIATGGGGLAADDAPGIVEGREPIPDYDDPC